ncbi:MAG: hypothetical protein OXG64_00805 [Chloroflexi bacterium]|nr:hypothetical protein [Chloroflexota bacterium]
MSVEQIEASFVLVGHELLPTEDAKSAFRQAIGLEAVNEQAIVIPPGGSAQLAADGHKITFPRERIALALSGVRSSVTKDFPSGEDDLRQLANVISEALRGTDLPEAAPWSFGFNASIVHTPKVNVTAPAYIAERLINYQRFAPAGEVVTGALALNITGGSAACRQWNLRLEPRFNDPATKRVFMALNHHFETDDLPGNAKNTFEYLHGVMDHVYRLIEVMDGHH